MFPSFEKQESIVPMTKHMDDLGLTIDIISPFNDTITEPMRDNIEATTSQQETRIGVYRFMLSNITLPYPDGHVFHYHIDRQVRSLVDRSIRRLRALKIKVIEYDLNPVEVVKMLLSVYNKTDQMLKSVVECSRGCRRDSLDKYLTRLGPNSPFRNSLEYETKSRKSLLGDFDEYKFF